VTLFNYKKDRLPCGLSYQEFGAKIFSRMKTTTHGDKRVGTGPIAACYMKPLYCEPEFRTQPASPARNQTCPGTAKLRRVVCAEGQRRRATNALK
jgi:hypothetical protein